MSALISQNKGMQVMLSRTEAVRQNSWAIAGKNITKPLTTPFLGSVQWILLPLPTNITESNQKCNRGRSSPFPSFLPVCNLMLKLQLQRKKKRRMPLKCTHNKTRDVLRHTEGRKTQDKLSAFRFLSRWSNISHMNSGNNLDCLPKSQIP